MNKKIEVEIRKCRTKDCKRVVQRPFVYCSIECACYDGSYDIRTGFGKLVEDGEGK